jgi:hypothetical protein
LNASNLDSEKKTATEIPLDELITVINEKKEKKETYFFKKLLEKLDYSETKRGLNSIFQTIFLILPLVLATYYSFYGLGVVTWVIGLIWVLSFLIPLIFRRYNLDYILLNAIVLVILLMFVFGFFPGLLYFVLVFLIIAYFLYLAIKNSKTYFSGVFITFIFLFLVIKYSNYLIYPLPFVEKAAYTTSSTISEAQSSATNALLGSADYFLSKFQSEGKKVLLAITDPVAYQKMLEKEREAKKNQLPSLGELSSFYFEKIITNTPITRDSISLGYDVKNNLILRFSYKLDKDLYTFISLIKNREFKDFKIFQKCEMFNNLKEKSGKCLINNKEFNELTINFKDYKKILDLNTYLELYDTDNLLKLETKFEGLSVGVGKIKENKVKALQLNSPLSIGLKFLYKTDENKLIGYIYYIDKLKEGSYIMTDPINTKNRVDKINISYLCLSKVDNQNVVKSFKVNGKETKGENILDDYFVCYKLVDNLKMRNPIESVYLEIELKNTNFLNNYEWIFYIVSKYLAVKNVEMNVKTENYLVPFFYLVKIKKLNKKSFLEDLDKLNLIENKNLEYNKSLLEKFFEENLENIDKFEEFRFLNNLDEKLVLKMLLASYLIQNYGFKKDKLCYFMKKNYDKNYDCSKFKIKDLANFINLKIKETNNFLKSRYNSCAEDLLASYDFRLFFNTLISKMEGNRVYYCDDLERVYGENYLEFALDLINEIKNINLAEGLLPK